MNLHTNEMIHYCWSIKWTERQDVRYTVCIASHINIY